jgi:hypothetical protein
MISPKRNQHYHGYMVRDDARACSILLQSFAIDHASATVLRLSKEAKASMMSRLAPYDIDRAAAVVLIACVNDRILWSRYPDPAQYLEFRELRAHIRWWSRRTRDGAMVRRGAISSGFRHKATRFWMAIRMIRPDDRRASIASSGPSSSSALCVFSPPAISACNLSEASFIRGNLHQGQLWATPVADSFREIANRRSLSTMMCTIFRANVCSFISRHCAQRAIASSVTVCDDAVSRSTP